MVMNTLGYCDTCKNRNNVEEIKPGLYHCKKANVSFTDGNLNKGCLEKKDINGRRG